MAIPDPANVAPWYLRNITQALALDETTGNVYLRTGFTGDIIIEGNVNIPGEIDTHINSVGTLGNITTPYLPVGGNVTVFQGTSPWVVTGNTNVAITSGNVGITGNIAGITANVTVVDGGGSLTVDGTVNANVTGGNVIATLDGTNLDAFGRLRVSNPVTLFDSQNRYLPGRQFSNVTATGGNVQYVANESSFNLNVSTANGSSAIQQSRFVQPYQPGKSMLVMESFCMGTLIANCRQRVGYFTANDGIYFEADGTALYLVIRSSASGSVVEERIAQANWNTDSLSNLVGTNPSGITLNPALVNIFWCDIEWLGVGTVRAGFVIDGQFIVCHKFNHANQAGNTKVYMTTATLNPRYEITNTGVTTGNTTLKQICSTVISEGGYAPATTENYLTSGIQPTRVAAANVYTSLCTIRLNPAYPDAVVIPAQLDLLLTDVQYGQYQLVLNASNVSGLTYANVTNSVVQANNSAVQIGDGTVLYGGVTSSRDTLTVSEDVAARLQLGRQANGTPDTLTLCVGYSNPNADLIWRFGWQEVTN
jgi:hypothetical protein